MPAEDAPPQTVLDGPFRADETAHVSLQEARSRLRRYEALVEVLEVLARASHSVTEVVGAIHEHSSRLIHTHVTLFALRGEGVWHCDVRNEDERFTREVPFDPLGLSEQVYLHGPLLVGDVDAYQAARGVLVRNLHTDGAPVRVKSYIAVPILLLGERAGILSVQSMHADAFTPLDLHFLELLGKHVSIALDHARLRERLEVQARTDGLTGLLNRHAFAADLEDAFLRAADPAREPWLLVVVDVQEFKRINDRCGHATGDAVLREVARHLERVAAARGRAYRVGGDEFALLLRDDPEAVEADLHAVQRALDALDLPNAPEVRVNAGLGAACGEPDTEAWLRLADDRMYAAKARRVLLLPVDFSG